VPTLDELGVKGIYASFWHGIWAPKGTPKDIVAKLNEALRKALANPATKKKLIDLAQDIFPPEQQAPEALRTFQQAEIDKWWPIIKKAGIKAQ
jgi:tripartite-type tricarboxylate transporter receptor subunit TctC